MKASKVAIVTIFVAIFVLGALSVVPLRAQTTSDPANLPQRDGSHDFDFLIGDWKAHVKRLPDRLNNSNFWVVYDGISNHHKLLDSNANFEQFDVTSTDKKLRIKAQTLRISIRRRASGASISSTLIMGRWMRLRWLAALPELAVSFSIRNNSEAAPFLCVTSGSISHPSRRAWSSLTHRTAARPGRSIGFASFRDKARA
jgi:hypothetical protein